MGLSLFLAKFLGVYFIIIGILMLVRKEVLRKGFQELLYMPGMLLFSGSLSLIAGLAIIIVIGLPFGWLQHDPEKQGLPDGLFLASDWFLTILGCLMVAKGIICLGWPDLCRDWAHALLRNNTSWLWLSIFLLAIGMFFVAYAFLSGTNLECFG